MAPGERVFAVRDATKEVVKLYGFGTYVGDHPCPIVLKEIGAGTSMLRNTIQGMIEDQDAGGAERDEREVWQQMDAQMVAEGRLTEKQAGERKQHRASELKADRARPLQERIDTYIQRMAKNPKIELDNGSVVWGMQCWWGSEERYEQWVGDRKVEEVSVK